MTIKMTINESIILIIVVVIIAIIIGMLISLQNWRFLNLNPKVGRNEDTEEYIEDLSINSNTREYNGGDIKLTLVDDIRGCIDTYNKDGLIDNILNKTLDPILYINDIKEQLPYTPTCIYYTTQHIRHLKLLINKINLCTIANDTYKNTFTFICIGSAPNHGGFILNKLFQNMKTILVDPSEYLLYKPNNQTHYDIINNEVLYFCCADTNKFNLKNRIINIFDGIKIQKLDRDSDIVKIISDKWRNADIIDDSYLKIVNNIISGNIEYSTYNNIIIEDYFKDETAEFCKKIPNIIFANNIRTNAYEILNIDNTFQKNQNTDLDICVNSAMMLYWVNIMKPKFSMLKFRPPYYIHHERVLFETYHNSGIYKHYFDKVKHQINFVSDYRKREFRYILGNEAIQAYAETSNGETQLIFTEIKIGIIDYVKRDEQLFYYNQIQRQYGFHISNIDSIAGVDHCGDCALAQKIISNYLSKYSIIDPNITINNMVSILRKSLNINAHGLFLSMNKHIYDIYKVQGNILLNMFMMKLYNIMTPRSIDINVEKRYQIKNKLHLKDMLSKLANIYIVDDIPKPEYINTFIYELMRYLSYKSMWYNQNIIYEYNYYYLTTVRSLSESNANELLSKLDNIYNKIQNSDYSNKANIIIETYDNMITVKYKLFEVNISKEWYYINDLIANKEIYLNAIMYDARLSASGFISIPNIIYYIINMIGYNNLYEISLGLHDMLFRDTLINTDITHFTHVNCGIKNTSDLKNIPPKTIIFGYYHASLLLADYLLYHAPNDAIIILYTLDTPYTNKNIRGFKISFPFSAINFMREPVKSHTTLISFHFNGPPEILYNIKNYYERSITNLNP